MFYFSAVKILEGYLVSKAKLPVAIGRFRGRSSPVAAWASREGFWFEGAFCLLVEGGFCDLARLELELVGFFGTVEVSFEEKRIIICRPAVGQPRVGNLGALFFIEVLHFSEPGFGSTVLS